MLKSEWVWGEVRVVSWAIHDMNLCKILSINCPSGGCQRVCPCARMTHICLVHVGERVGGARVRMCVLHVMYLRLALRTPASTSSRDPDGSWMSVPPTHCQPEGVEM